MKVIVSGATGFVGSHLARCLAEESEVHCLGRGELPGEAAANLCWHRADLGDGHLPDSLPENADAVVHLAQSRRYREFPEGATDVFAVNVAAAHRLLEYARQAGCTKFVLASSGGIYGAGAAPFREDDAPKAGGELGFYAASKRCAETLAEAYSEFFDVAAARIFFAYGPGQSEFMLMPRLIDSVRLGKPVTLKGSMGFQFNPIFVEDLVHALVQSLLREARGAINLAGPDVLTLREVCVEIGRQVGREPVFEQVGEETSPGFVGELTRMRELVGPPSTIFSEGLRRTLEGTLA